MVMDSMFVVCTRCKIIAIFHQFLFPAMAGRRITLHIKYYRFGERAGVVPFLSAHCPGKRAETALRASRKWEFPLPGKSWCLKKFLRSCSSDATQNGLPDVWNPFDGGMTLRYPEDPKISWQPNPWVVLDLVLALSVNLSPATSVL